jgi:hypothetical protein
VRLGWSSVRAIGYNTTIRSTIKQQVASSWFYSSVITMMQDPTNIKIKKQVFILFVIPQFFRWRALESTHV